MLLIGSSDDVHALDIAGQATCIGRFPKVLDESLLVFDVVQLTGWEATTEVLACAFAVATVGRRQT